MRVEDVSGVSAIVGGHGFGRTNERRSERNGLLVETTTPDKELSVVPLFTGEHRLVVSSDRLNDPTGCWVRDCDTGKEIPAERQFTIILV